MDILGDVLPSIPGEETKLEREPRSILGSLRDGTVAPAPFTVSAQTFRMPVVEGHVLSVSVRLRRPAGPEEAAEAIRRFGLEAGAGLPSSPPEAVRVLDGDDAPRPRLHSEAGGGMTVSVGRIRRCPVHHLRFVALVHNTARGAAGGVLLTAEFLAAEGLLSSPATPGCRGRGS